MTTTITKHKTIAVIGLLSLIVLGVITIALSILQRSKGQPLTPEAIPKGSTLAVIGHSISAETNFGPASGRQPVPKEQQSTLRPPIPQNATPVLSGQVALNLTPFREPIFYRAQRSVSDLKAWYAEQMGARGDTVLEETNDLIIFSSTQGTRTEIAVWEDNGQTYLTVFVYYLAE